MLVGGIVLSVLVMKHRPQKTFRMLGVTVCAHPLRHAAVETWAKTNWTTQWSRINVACARVNVRDDHRA